VKGLLSDLNEAVDSLRAATARLDAALSGLNVQPFLRARVGDTAGDILDAVVLIEEAHSTAATAQDAQTRRIFEVLPTVIPPADSQGWSLKELAAWFARQPQPTREQWDEAVRLLQGELTNAPFSKVKVAYKALLFFVRAHQDALYRAFLQACGEKAGQKSSMSSGLADGKPLAELFSDCIPLYRDWFWRWRERRNQVKNGVNVGFTSIDRFGLLFNFVSDDGGLVVNLSRPPLSLPDVIEAVSMSAAAADCIATYVLRDNASVRRHCE
jgi:hypothetical protein